MDKLASIRAFTKVVAHGSFSEAARELRLSRSAVSKYVIDLEEALGVQLLNRTTRSASPTENGQAYYERCLADLEEADLLVSRLQAEPRGLLRVNAPMSFGTLHLGRCVAEFMERYPDLQIQLILSDQLIDPVQEGFDRRAARRLPFHRRPCFNWQMAPYHYQTRRDVERQSEGLCYTSEQLRMLFGLSSARSASRLDTD
jgi:DNA-binding transcriptional LysR family regulator